jgi:hypothetical protein
VQTLLEHLPTATINLAQMPQEALRDLCEAFRITITYDRDGRRAHYSAEIAAHTLRHLRSVAAAPYVRFCDVPPAGLEPALRRF